MSQTGSITPNNEDASASAKGTRAAVARQRILLAVVECLDRYGYAQTSINRIQKHAGVSRGALTHHFPSKEELMVVAAAHLLQPTLRPRRAERGDAGKTSNRRAAIESDIVWMWEKLVNTVEGRALLEILVASRTDSALQNRISESFTHWNRAINDSLIANYPALGVSEVEQREIWSLCRTFLRGLNTQSQFEQDQEALNALLRSFARMITSHFIEKDLTALTPASD